CSLLCPPSLHDALPILVRMEDELTAVRLNARMLLQVHDELVFEVPEAEVAKTLPLVARVMTNAPLPAVSLSVPLHVDAKAADNRSEEHTSELQSRENLV